MENHRNVDSIIRNYINLTSSMIEILLYGRESMNECWVLSTEIYMFFLRFKYDEGSPKIFGVCVYDFTAETMDYAIFVLKIDVNNLIHKLYSLYRIPIASKNVI